MRGFGCGGLEPAIRAAGALLEYVKSTQRGALPHITALAVEQESDYLLLDAAYVAAGRFDGFWEIGLNAWDIAAGCLLVQEAGGLVGDFRGNDGYLQSGNVVAGNPKIFAQLLQTLAQHLTDKL